MSWIRRPAVKADFFVKATAFLRRLTVEVVAKLTERLQLACVEQGQVTLVRNHVMDNLSFDCESLGLTLLT
jgi:hypothetical protein